MDIIFDAAGTSRSYWLALFSKAKLKFGFPYKHYLCGTLYNIAVFRSDFQPEVETMLDMLKLLGHAPSHPLNFGYPCHYELFGQQQTKPKIIYFNGASVKDKVLEQAQVKLLIEQALSSLPDYQHVFLEGMNDFERGDYLEDLRDNSNFSIQLVMSLGRVDLS